MTLQRYVPATVVCVIAICIGLLIASEKSMGNDEFYSTVSSIQNISYEKMIVGKIPEGNNTPLFYLMQKIMIDVTAFRVPESWLMGQWSDVNDWDRVILRINPVFFMSLSIAFIFHFFLSRVHWFAGFLSVFIYFSTYILWPFWAEARPYALLVFLTTVQLICFVMVVESQGKVGLRRLITTHILLSVTSIFSLGLIAVASCILLFHQIDNMKKYCFWMILPLAAIFFYYSHAPRYPFYFDLTPEQLIRDNISRERFYIFIAFIIFWFYWAQKKVTLNMKVAFVSLKFLIGVFIVTIGYILVFKLGAKPYGEGFPVTSRYFIYLMPIGVMVCVWACVCLNSFFSSWRVVKYCFWIIIASLLVPRFFKIVPRAISSIMG